MSAILCVNRAATQAGITAGDEGGLARVLADLVIPELLMAAITVGFVAAVFALAQVIVLAFITLEGQRGEITALVGAIAKGLLVAKSTHTEKILLVFFEG
jgi:hypothetical protein